jgi:mRNA-degrading endonuclease RelE of RelBE toxin-antitoxin system
MPWRLALSASAQRTLARLTEQVASAIVELMTGPLLDEPTRVGKPLHRELAGYWVARRGSYRVIYRLEEERRTIRVVRIEHRSDVYRPR